MKYWAYVNNEILGPFEKDKLLELPAFSPSLLVCPQTPVGEKTEDWKEAATYPEISALIASGSGLAPKPEAGAPAAAQPPSAEPVPRDIVEPGPAITSFKPLTPSTVEPVAPSHREGGIDIPAHHLGKAGGEAVPAQAPAAEPQPAAQAASAFDPLTLSSINRKAEEMPGIERNAPAPAGETPKPSFGAPELETFARPAALNPAPAQAPQPLSMPEASPEPAPMPAAAQEPSPAPVPAPEASPVPAAAVPASSAAPAFDLRALEALAQKLDAISRNAVSRQDVSALVDPLRLKLDQLGETVSSLDGRQFQREVMGKLSALESAVGELKASGRQAAPAAAPAPGQEAASIAPAEPKAVSGRTIFGAKPPAKDEPRPEPEPAKAQPARIVDTGSKSAKFPALLKKLGKGLATAALLAAVLLGGVVFLKNFGIFDATAFLPFPLPFTQKQTAEQPVPEQQPPAGQPAAEQPQAGQPGQGQQAAAPQQPKAPDISPEIIYFTRTYKLSADGPTLEDKIAESAAASGGDYNRVDWKVAQGAEGIFEISAKIPAKNGDLSYTFVVDYAKKTLLPGDDLGRAALAALAPAPVRRPAARAKKPAAGRKAAPRRAAAAPKPKTAPKAAAPAAKDDEYEYVYEDDDGTGQ